MLPHSSLLPFPSSRVGRPWPTTPSIHPSFPPSHRAGGDFTEPAPDAGCPGALASWGGGAWGSHNVAHHRSVVASSRSRSGQLTPPLREAFLWSPCGGSLGAMGPTPLHVDALVHTCFLSSFFCGAPPLACAPVHRAHGPSSLPLSMPTKDAPTGYDIGPFSIPSSLPTSLLAQTRTPTHPHPTHAQKRQRRDAAGVHHTHTHTQDTQEDGLYRATPRVPAQAGPHDHQAPLLCPLPGRGRPPWTTSHPHVLGQPGGNGGRRPCPWPTGPGGR